MIFKSYLIEKNLTPINNTKLALFYGENNGLKKDLKDKIKAANNKYEKITFFCDEIVKNKDILINEINNRSLFNTLKLIFIEQANDKIVEILEHSEKIIEEEKIYLFSETLDKKSKLRQYFEKSKKHGIIPCYQDNEINIKNLIREKLKKYEGLTPEIINLIADNSNLERGKINNELDKISSFFINKILIKENIEELLNIKKSDDFNQLKDEALKGNKIKTNKLLNDTAIEDENNFFYLNLINQRINRLAEIDELKKNNKNLDTIISSLKPPIFWKDKSNVIEQAKIWNKKKIIIAMKKTHDIEIKLKSGSIIDKKLLLKNLIIDLCVMANSA